MLPLLQAAIACKEGKVRPLLLLLPLRLLPPLLLLLPLLLLPPLRLLPPQLLHPPLLLPLVSCLCLRRGVCLMVPWGRFGPWLRLPSSPCGLASLVSSYAFPLSIPPMHSYAFFHQR